MEVVSTAGGVHRLSRQAPTKIAMGWLLTGKQFTAADGHRWGLVNEVVPDREVMAAAERWAAEMVQCAPLSLRATKQMAVEGAAMPLDDAMATPLPRARSGRHLGGLRRRAPAHSPQSAARSGKGGRRNGRAGR